MQNEELLYRIALSKIPGIGNVLARQLVASFGSAKEVFKKPPGKLQKAPGIGPKLAQALSTFKGLKEAEKEVSLAESKGVSIISQHDKEYPSRLKHTPDAPFFFYKKGNTHLNASKIIGIVGTRKASDYGIELTKKLVKDLCSLEDCLIVSGLAYGIDITAHKACIQQNVTTVAVLANGLGTVYPEVHRGIAHEMIEKGGCLVSEYPINAKPDAPHFPERNRIIAGLCDAIVVVEAAVKGGALITADIANSYDREVFSFPGDVNRVQSAGCHNLIKNHEAHLISDASDIIKVMNWDIPDNLNIKQLKFELPEHITGNDRICMEALGKESRHFDDLLLKTGLNMSELAASLLSLELSGYVLSLPGKRYRKAV